MARRKKRLKGVCLARPELPVHPKWTSMIRRYLLAFIAVWAAIVPCFHVSCMILVGFAS